MADFSNFVPAFTYPIKWSVGDNTFDDADKFPKTIWLCGEKKGASCLDINDYKINLWR